MAKKNKKTEATLALSRGIRGLDRKAHFASGGDLVAWRGRHSVTADRKKVADKHACRGPIATD